ncbi:hypothetical protein [Exiguobacterium sp. ERU656]|uniref:hypothetical protein n=1 Tax=Exiguobacterium sp. ERU656 TaxID=2751217 RepID=UPI001BE980C4|nr:hypothetical protein [Exiguobacterium sp. ERU656]
MTQAAMQLTPQESQFSLLLTKLDDSKFVMKFAEDPYMALEESGLNMDLTEFTTKISEDKVFYDLLTKKLSKVVDVPNMAVPSSSCCN